MSVTPDSAANRVLPGVDDLRSAQRGWARQVGVAAQHLWQRAYSTWQRSIQVRVVTATLLLSLVVVGILGATLLRQITDGLLQAKINAAVADATAGINDAQHRLDASNNVEPAMPELLTQLVQDLATRGAPAGLYEVVLINSEGGETRVSRDVLPESVPAELRQSVVSEPAVFRTFTTIRYSRAAQTSVGADRSDAVPGLAIGAQIEAPSSGRPSSGQYELYYLFPLTEQEETLGLVRQAVATAGLLLVLLLGAVAGLVVRQVVTPVRQAARIAERFSAGRLDERMAVRGKDDLARLATSFNQMATSLRQQIRQLEDLSRVQRRFVSDVSHELRTPLTTVRMAADVLHESRDGFDPAVRRSAELLQNQLDRFESLLGDLLEISRFDAGAAVLDPESVDLRDQVQSVVDAVAPLAGKKSCRIVLDLPDEPCVADVDSRRVERILRNLVVNAVEHSEGRDVTVRVGCDDHAVAVAVRDRGVGLKPGEATQVFNRFWRADQARARTTGGTGLGLAIALEDARLHNGWLQAWGEPGEGSQFRLTLPRRAGADLASSPLPLVPDDRRTRGQGPAAREATHA